MNKKVSYEEKIRVDKQVRNELERVKLNFEVRTKNWPEETRMEFSAMLEKEIMRVLVNRYLYK